MNNFPINILVLDDEPFMHKLLIRMLENIGFSSVIACDNGRAALESIDNPETPADLILLDINMPKMDGLKFVRHLVERNFKGSLILISGEDERMQLAAEKLARAHQIIVLGHLHKPASPDRLAALIGKWMPPSQIYTPQVKKIYDADELRRAITQGELVNYYQPQVQVATGWVVGVETLVRWNHPEDGLVLPDQFIGVAETNGLIDDLTRVVLCGALEQSRIWQDAGLMLRVAVNLSMDNLVSVNFFDEVVNLATKAGVPPQMMVLEVTESRLMVDIRTPLEILARLRLNRFRMAIDDFGIGNSSLAQLRDLPFDELKIDQSFVHGAGNDGNLRAIFDSCLSLAKQLNMEVIAEGVEDQSDWEFVRKTECDIAQGYFIAKPMPAADLTGWIQSWQSPLHATHRRV